MNYLFQKNMCLLNLENVSSNQSQNCFRECKGDTKVCYFEFKMENFVTLSGYVKLNMTYSVRLQIVPQIYVFYPWNS